MLGGTVSHMAAPNSKITIHNIYNRNPSLLTAVILKFKQVHFAST